MNYIKSKRFNKSKNTDCFTFYFAITVGQFNAVLFDDLRQSLMTLAQTY